ncbi:esterase/lipase/thioesterase family protein [Salix suchowensis]|nr:esterase/lipase/thioesterase family protein [Salix suchowensis]
MVGPTPPTETIGCVAVVHGFTGESSWLVQLTSVLFAKHGFVVCAIDHQGHGFSDGLDNLIYHIPDINPVVEDCMQYFKTFRETRAPNLPAFLYSESLGGAIALYIALRQRGAWDGLILNGAMCGISAKFKPPWPWSTFFSVIPTRGSITDLSFKEEWKRKLGCASPRRVAMRPRAATAYELMRVCTELQGRFEEVDVPLLVVHGGDDGADKTLKMYSGMWHQLIGEPEKNVNLVFGDMVEWLQNRAERYKKDGDVARAAA